MPPTINTYHCHCTSLVLASTHTLSKLPTRHSLDKAIILPLPPSPHPPPSGRDDDAARPPSQPLGDTLLLSLTADARPTIVRRDDGFEKRFLHRCGRCRLVLAYALDAAHFPAEAAAADEPKSTKLLYILPRGLMSSEIMAQGRKIGEAEVDLLGTDQATLGVWE